MLNITSSVFLSTKMLLPLLMSKLVTAVLLLTVVTNPVSTAIIAINPDRIQLMKDVLSWMNFRREGNLATADDYEASLLPDIKERYSDSKYYRTFVIAFHQGVLPKLTLLENQACDPSYVWKYKHPSNNLITWYGMKKFTFESYQKRDDPSIQYCDYRQGLVCNPRTSKCECAQGSSMSPVSPGSSVQKCMLDKDEPCGLIDFDQGLGPDSIRDKKLLSEMIFNLEKPLACKQGTQCRLTHTERFVSRCYDATTDPSQWIIPSGSGAHIGEMILGRECSLGVASFVGMCRKGKDLATKEKVGGAPGYYCFDFGPPRSSPKDKVSRVGFCAHELGSWQIRDLNAWSHESYSKLWNGLFIMAFVHRRSVPLDADQLFAYYKRFIDEVLDKVFGLYDNDSDDYNGNQLRVHEGDDCNVAKTKKMGDIWKYYMGLEEDPPTGKDFVASATKQELDTKLQEMKDLVNLNDGKFCKVYWSFFRRKYGYPLVPLPPLTCVAGTPSGNNDGKCRVVNDDSTKPFAEKVQQLADFALDAVEDEYNENHGRNLDTAILIANPEPECTPIKAQLAKSLDTLEGGSCLKNSICIQNYEDALGIYDASCNLKPGIKLRYDCQDTSGGGNTGNCEGQILDKMIKEKVEQIGTQTNLGRGQKCRLALEKEIRDGIESGQWNGNKYKMLVTMTKEVESGTESFCDRARLLECTDKDQGTCQCVNNTEPRMTTLNSGNPGFGSSGSVILNAGDPADSVYLSDYCYLKEGPCTGLQDLLNGLSLTQTEIDKIWEHYGKSDGSCMEGNTCVFLDLENLQCTTNNTGKTGHDLKPVPTTTKGPGEPLAPPRPYGGADGNYHKNFGILGWSLTLFTLLI